MNAVKIYNNNAVSTVWPDGREAILIGNGIGFHKRPGDTIDEKKIENIYYIQNDLQTRFLQLLKDAKPEALEISEKILEHALECGLELKNQLILSLTDHISFAMERYEQNIELPYLMLSETRMLYTKEFEIGRWAIEQIKKEYQIALPEYEAGYIALQLASSSMNRETTVNILVMVKGALDIIKEVYEIEMDPEHIDTIRLTTHLKFLAQRILGKTQWHDDNMEGILQMLLMHHPQNGTCIKRLRDYIQKEFHYCLNSQEEVYLLIHINKILHK